MIAPTVSVLVTVYNREQFLETTLRSILASTFKDFELIVVDDASSDNSLSIAGRIAEKDKRVIVHRNDANLGDYGNRAKAASLARGTYIKYVDSDDLIYPHSLSVMVEAMEAYPDAALALSHSMPEDISPYPWCLAPEEAYRKHFLERGCLNCGPTGAIIKKDAFDAVGGFDKSWGVLSDMDLWLRVAARWKIVLLPPGLVWWRRHESQEYTKNDARMFYLQRGYELNTQALNNSLCPLRPDEQDTALNRCRQHFARRTLSLALVKGKLRTAYEIFKKSDLSFQNLLAGFKKYQ
jgi:glycosyltransferase involved in cell wall biosynthesis